jgi:predicted phosphate transport protein (TIGR00153 family)
MNTIFKKSVELNMKIEKFLDTISNSLLLFEQQVDLYLAGDFEAFCASLKRIESLESEADELETEIKITLYKFMLLPDARADVLSLIKSLDDIIDEIEEISKDVKIQRPVFPQSVHSDIKNLASNTVKTSESLLLAARSFFTEVHLVSSYVNKVKFYEHETDILEDGITDHLFNDGIVEGLAEKMQLKDFICKIANISDMAEQTADKLTIFTIKREI